MRPFEWLVALSFLPGLLLLLLPVTWRRRWALVSTLLPLLATAFQVVVEGWRIQLIPLYALALLLGIRELALRRRVSTARPGRMVLARSLTALWVVFGSIIANWVLPVPMLPQPTGPYPVGIVQRELVDAVRNRRLMVSVWYPAAARGAPAPLTEYPAALATALSNLSGLPALAFQHLRYVSLAASDAAPVLTTGVPFPVLVFSHGMVGLRSQSSSTMQELASRGYVVVALDHTDAAAVTVFPDGQTRFYDLAPFGIPSTTEPTRELMNTHVLPVWIADQRLVYDTLEAWQARDPLLAGRLDLQRIGSFGHSFGGATALEVCRVDPRCLAAANMDGALYGESANQPARRPVLVLSSAESNAYPNAAAGWTALIANATTQAYWLELPNSTHLSFTFTQLLSPLLVPRGFAPRAGLSVIDTYLCAFFDLHLRGVNTHVLDETPGQTDVRWRLRKH